MSESKITHVQCDGLVRLVIENHVKEIIKSSAYVFFRKLFHQIFFRVRGF